MNMRLSLHLKMINRMPKRTLETVNANAFLTLSITCRSYEALLLSRLTWSLSCLSKTRLCFKMTSCRCLTVLCKHTQVSRSRYACYRQRHKACKSSKSVKMLKRFTTKKAQKSKRLQHRTSRQRLWKNLKQDLTCLYLKLQASSWLQSRDWLKSACRLARTL